MCVIHRCYRLTSHRAAARRNSSKLSLHPANQKISLLYPVTLSSFLNFCNLL